MNLYEDPKDEKKIVELTGEISKLVSNNEFGIIVESITQLLSELIVDASDDENEIFIWAYHIQKDVIEKAEIYREYLDKNDTN